MRRTFLLTVMFSLILAVFASQASAQRVDFTVRTSTGNDTLIVGMQGSIIFDINTNGVELSAIEQDMAFTFTNGNIVGVVEQAPSTTTAEFIFSPFTLAVMELPAFADGDHFTGAPVDSLRWGAANMFPPGLNGADEFARLTFTPLDTGVIVLDTFKITTVRNMTGTPHPHTWAGAKTIWVVSDCAVLLTGDVNIDGAYTSADIIVMVNSVFKGGSPPEPCPAAMDVNCDGVTSAADIIFMVNFVFKGGPPPCDICNDSPLGITCT